MGRARRVSDGRAAKVWEVLLRAAVPISIAVAGVVIAHEVRLGQHDTRLEHAEQMLDRHQESIGDMPTWLRLNLVNKIETQGVQLTRIQALLEAMEKRMERLESH